nr:class I SAM-dependent methyltransferase [Halobacterium sp. CBA1126]
MANPSLSAKNYHINRRFHPHIHQFAASATGDVLDVGCGDKPHRGLFEDTESYTGLDVTNVEKDIDVCGSATKLPFKDQSFDVFFSTQVLEHVPDPTAFFTEMARVLKDGGRAFVSTNQMYPLHEEPNDYFRFTRYGLSHLSQEVGLTVDKIIEEGTLPMRVCCEINYVLSAVPTIGGILTAAMNTIAAPIVSHDHREEYIVTGVVLNKTDF